MIKIFQERVKNAHWSRFLASMQIFLLSASTLFSVYYLHHHDFKYVEPLLPGFKRAPGYRVCPERVQ